MLLLLWIYEAPERAREIIAKTQEPVTTSDFDKC